MMLFKGLLAFFIIESLSSFHILRDASGDQLSCIKTVDCSRMNSYQLDDSTCKCKRGSLVKTDNQVQCMTKDSTTPECGLAFNGHDEEVLTISVDGSVAEEFEPNIVSKKTNCRTMSLKSVQYLNDNFEWSDTDTKDFSLLSSSSGKFTIRWVNPFQVNKEFYSGQFLKFMLFCKETEGSPTSQTCLYGKITGSKTWETEMKNDVCYQAMKPRNRTNTNTNNTMALTTETPNNNKQNSNEAKSSSIGLIGGVTAAVLVLLVVIVIIIICVRRRKFGGRKSEEAEEVTFRMKEEPVPVPSSNRKHHEYDDPANFQQPTHSDEYNDDHPQYQPIEFENKGYLTTLKNQSSLNQNKNNNKNYENYDLPDTDNQKSGLLPKRSKQNGKLAKPVVLPTTNNTYEPIFTDFKEAAEVKKPSYSTPKDANDTQYDNLNSPRSPESDTVYMDMSSEYVVAEPVYD